MTGFVHAGFIAAGGALAAVPVLIHLLHRRHARREPWGAMVFLRRAQRRTRHRLRLEQWLLLFLRSAALFLFALAAAQPIFSAEAVRGSSPAPWWSSGRTDHVLVLDDSLSMQAVRADGRTAFDAARNAARRLLEAMGPSDGVAILTLSAPARALTPRPVHDRARAHRILDGLACTARPADVAGALARAAEALSHSDLPVENRRVSFLTDRRRGAWSSPDVDGQARRKPQTAPQNLDHAAKALSRAARVQIIDAGAEHRGNAAVISLECATRVVRRGLPLDLAARIANHDDHPLNRALLEIRIDGKTADQLKVPRIDADGVAVVRWRMNLERSGYPALSVHLHRRGAAAAGGRNSDERDDALAVDNSRHLVLEVTDRPRVLIIESGSSGAGSAESYYLVRALAPRTAAEPYFEPLILREQDAAAEPLRRHAAVFLVNVRVPSVALWERLAAYVADGGGLVVALGPRVDARRYNHEGAALMPAELQPAEATSADPDETEWSRAAVLRGDDWSHPMLADFRPAPVGGLLTARFARCGRVSTRADAATILRTSTGQALLCERTVGRGRVLLWTSTFDLRWNNLPAKPDFVPLILNLAASVARDGTSGRNGLVGDLLDEPLDGSEAASAIIVRRPHGRESTVAARMASGRLVVRPGAAADDRCDQPGVYEVRLSTGTRRLCANVDASQADLRPLPDAAFSELFGHPVPVYPDSALARQTPANAGRYEASAVLLGGVFVIVLAETLLAAWFGHRR